MSENTRPTSRTCTRRLIFSITGPGWVWDCDWPGVRARRDHDHDQATPVQEGTP